MKCRLNADMTAPALAVSNVFGMIGFPASSVGAAIFTAHKMVAMWRNIALFAMCRPMQILWSYIELVRPVRYVGIQHTSVQSPDTRDVIMGIDGRNPGRLTYDTCPECEMVNLVPRSH